MKKLIAVLLAALMCASILMACGGGGTSGSTAAPSKATGEATKEASKEATKEATEEAGKDDDWPAETYQAKFILYVPQDGWAGADRVKKYIKDLTTKDLNIACEIVPMTFATANAQVPMMLSAKEQIDVMNALSGIRLQFEQGYVVDLLDYKKQIQPAIDLLGEDEIMASLIDGHLLGLPGQLERTHRYGMAMRTDILEEVGYDPKEINGDIEDAYDKASEIFAKVREAHPQMTIMGGPNNSPPPCNTQHTDYLTDGYGVLDNYGETFDVVNYYETPYFNKSVSYMKKWYDAGYIQQDISVSSDSYESLVKAGNCFGGCCPMKPDSYAEKRDQCNYDMTIFYFREDMMLAYGGGGYAVAGTAKDKVQAARLLSYAFTSRDFNDAINWGQPGVDWVESPDNDNTAMYPEGIDVSNAQWHNSYGWAYPNERVAHVWIGNDPDMYRKIYVDAEKDSHRTKAWGFTWDNSQYQDTISALDNIKTEYLYQIASGSVDVEAMSKEYNDKMYKSGLQDMMNEKQRQLDEWCKEKGIER